MKRNYTIIAGLILALGAMIILGCGVMNLDIGGGDSSTSNIDVIVGGWTLNTNGTVSYSILSFAASDYNLKNLGTAKIKTPDGQSHNYSVASGGITADNYYVGSSPQSLGTAVDQFTETSERQLFCTIINYAAPLNGIYTATMGSNSKEITMNQTDYMPALADTDISTMAGTGNLNVTTGDKITVNNQNNEKYRYLCRIYDNQQSSTSVSKLWTSTDIRGIHWSDPDYLYSFFTNNTQAASNGKVEFSIPGGALDQGINNLKVIINVFDTTHIEAGTTGDMKSFILPISEIRLDFSGR